MIVKDTKDLVETDDYVIIEATLSEGDIVRIIPISTNPI